MNFLDYYLVFVGLNHFVNFINEAGYAKIIKTMILFYGLAIYI